MIKERAFMMLEMLLVVCVAAIIFIVGFQYYRNSHRLMQWALVNNDVVIILASLNRFYEHISCDEQGVLQTALNTDVIAQLDLLHPLQARAPYVRGYHAVIKNTGVMSNQQKPIYILEVSAVIDPTYLPMLNTLQQYWLATRYSGNTLYWDHLPNNTMTQPGSDLWVLNVSNNAFRHFANNTAVNSGVYSHAYCAQ